MLTRVRGINNQFTDATQSFMGSTSVELSSLLSNVTNKVLNEFNPKFAHTISDAQDEIEAISNATFNSTEQLNNISTLFRIIQDSIFNNFNIEPPKTDEVVLKDPNEEWSRNMDAFILVVEHLSRSAQFMLIQTP